MIARSQRKYIGFFVVAVLVALILLSAAVLKWLYPPSRDPLFYKMVGVFEALVSLGLLLYYKTWRVWVLLALIVSVWMGFSFYVTFFGLPCSCMGGVWHLPRGISLSLNGGMLLGALTVLRYHPAHPLSIQRLVWFFGLFFMTGFIASTIYYSQ